MERNEMIIIWGAGKASLKRYEWAVFAGYKVLFFVDNNPALWGKRLNNILIKSPMVLKDYNCTILTSDMYFNEIREQLEKIAYVGHQIGFKQFKMEAVCRKSVRVDMSNAKINSRTSFVFDSYFPGMNWGGTEEWSCMVANAIAKLGVQTHMICGMNDKFGRFTSNCMLFEEEDEISMISKMAPKIAECLPNIFVSHISIALYAVQVVKAIFCDKIKLIIIVHGDDPYIYDSLSNWADRVDKIVCISEKIYTVLQEQYGLAPEKLIYKPNPIRIPTITNNRKINEKTLKIGFAARLAKELKRAHLLCELIEVCIQKGLDVEFNIAGEGECLGLLKRYVTDRKLENRIHILGWIPPTDMAAFWERQDIYLNISSSEGLCLAMLEAMACGCVPVVTDVSGVSDVIEDGKNGFVVSVEHWLQTVDKIEILSNERKLIHSIGVYNMNLIKDRFDVTDYAKWMIEAFDDDFRSIAE